MNDRLGGESSVSGDSSGSTLYKKDFWSKENLKCSSHYRLEKSARIINRLARAKEFITLLDVGCGPATLEPLLRSNIQYYGIDIAIHDPAPNFIEADLVNTPIRFDGKRFDIVIAQGFFEYMGTFQERKFAEISQLLSDGGIFIVSYVNFGHRDRTVYWPYSNVQPLNDFRQSLAKYFEIKRSFPTSYNWHHSAPNRKFIRAANMYFNMNVPFISPLLGTQYFFICSKLSFRAEISPVESRRPGEPIRLQGTCAEPDGVPSAPATSSRSIGHDRGSGRCPSHNKDHRRARRRSPRRSRDVSRSGVVAPMLVGFGSCRRPRPIVFERAAELTMRVVVAARMGRS
jgi:SAM-dependent methyltransferase